MASPEDICESLNIVMMNFVGMKNYIKAGKIQEEVQNLTKLQEEINQAAAERDFEAAGHRETTLLFGVTEKEREEGEEARQLAKPVFYTVVKTCKEEGCEEREGISAF